MTALARLFVRGGNFAFNADVPYDQQLLFEYADGYARQEGSIQLDLDGVRWTVNASMRRSPRCTGCGARVSTLTYSAQHRLFCPRCARTLCLAIRDGQLPGPRKGPRGKGAVRGRGREPAR